MHLTGSKCETSQLRHCLDRNGHTSLECHEKPLAPRTEGSQRKTPPRGNRTKPKTYCKNGSRLRGKIPPRYPPKNAAFALNHSRLGKLTQTKHNIWQVKFVASIGRFRRRRNRLSGVSALFTAGGRLWPVWRRELCLRNLAPPYSARYRSTAAFNSALNVWYIGRSWLTKLAA